MNLWKGEFIMRKNVKIIVGVVVLILVLVVGSFVGLIINRTNDHKFGRYARLFDRDKDARLFK